MNDRRARDRAPVVSSIRSTTLAVLAGGGFLISIMLGLAGLAVALGWISRDETRHLDLRTWLLLEVAGGAVASIASGVICRRMAGSFRGPVILAGVVFTVGLLECAEILRYVASGQAEAPTWLVLIAPLVGAVGVLLGGGVPKYLSLAGVRETSARRLMPVVLLRYALPAVVFAAATLLSLLVLPQLPGEPRREVFAAALTLDFTMAVPALVYMLLIRTRRAPWIVVVPTIVLGYAMATATIPGEHHAALHVVRILAVPAELALIAYFVVLARRSFVRAPVSGDFATRFRRAAQSTLGSRVPADILTTELAILYYAFRWPKATLDVSGAYTVHRRVGYAAVVFGLIVVLVAESAAVHFLVSHWNPTVAWILTGLSLYACVWLVGDFRAMAARRIRLTPTHLFFRMGLRWEADIPVGHIHNVELVTARDERRKSDTLGAVLLGQPHLRITLDRPVAFTGMYGLRRTVAEIWLTVDDAAGLREEIMRLR